MPSALLLLRSYSDDLKALEDYAAERRSGEAGVDSARKCLPLLRIPFKQYEKNFQTPTKLLLPKELKGHTNFLYKLYSSGSRYFSYIGELRRTLAPLACPYCGLRKNITLDHYLPRKKIAFPHFSFLSLNLVHACASCQAAKGSWYQNLSNSRRRGSVGRVRKWLGNATGVSGRRIMLFSESAVTRRRGRGEPIQDVRRLVHPYMDQFLAYKAFDLRLVWKHDIPILKGLIWKPHLCADQRALLAFHVRKVQIVKRSRDYIKKYFRLLLRQVNGQMWSQARIRQHIRSQMRGNSEFLGVANSIDMAFLRYVVRDDVALRLLEEESKKIKPKLIQEAVERPNARAFRRFSKGAHRNAGRGGL